jgi:23S rRNA pseudouridine1911/1915/1917 synthase
LSEQIRLGKMSKTYWALVEGRVEPTQATWRHYLRKDDAAHRMRVCRQEDHPASQIAELSYQVTGYDRLQGHEVSQVSVQLLTGRKHQIRVQFAHNGFPVVGDQKYGSMMRLLGDGIGLHSYGLQFKHPTRDELLQFEQPPPASWPRLN